MLSARLALVLGSQLEALRCVAAWLMGGRCADIARHLAKKRTLRCGIDPSPDLEVPPHMNDRNLREPSRYREENECALDYLDHF